MQWALCQVYDMQPAQLCVRMSINDIPDRDGICTYVHENIGEPQLPRLQTAHGPRS